MHWHVVNWWNNTYIFHKVVCYSFTAMGQIKQEAQLMLTNLCDAFRGQTRSPNIVPFHMLGIVFYCAIVNLSLRRAVFPIFDFKKCHDLHILQNQVRGHSRSLKVVPVDRLSMVSYKCSIETSS